MKSVIYQDSMLFHPPELGSVLFLPGLPGGGNKIYDRSPYGSIGTLSGAVWTKTPGGVPCLSFDGVDDYVTIANVPSLQIIGDLTLKAWARSTNYTPKFPLFNKNVMREYALVLNSTASPNGRVRFWHGDGSSYELLVDVSNILPIVNTWFHIALVRASSVKRCYLYINGILKYTSDVYVLTPAISTSDLWLGKDSSGYAVGNMALAEIHRRAWQALDVQNSFNREKSVFGVW